MGTEYIPVYGIVYGVISRGRSGYLWWGEEADGNDMFLGCDGVLDIFSTAQECITFCQQRGYPGEESPENAVIVDTGRVERWSAGKVLPVPERDLLSLWNLRDDLARSTGMNASANGRLAYRIYSKLTAASLPEYFPRTPNRIIWNRHEVHLLHRFALEHLDVVSRVFTEKAVHH